MFGCELQEPFIYHPTDFCMAVILAVMFLRNLLYIHAQPIHSSPVKNVFKSVYMF